MIYLRTQKDILDEIESRMRDVSNSRWTEIETYRALNDALEAWGTRVGIEVIYTLTNGYTSGTYEYDLPTYVRPPIRLQHKVPIPHYEDVDVDFTDTYVWHDVPGWDLVPNDTDGYTVQFASLPQDLDGRVIWTIRNGPVPVSVPTLNAECASDATTLVLASVEPVTDSGYVKVNGEWISYAGITRGTTTTTLNNLTRGVYDTTAATHAAASKVYWGIGVHRLDLLRQLYDQMRAMMHELYLTNAAPRERDVHERLLSFYQQRADDYWKRYTSGRPAQMNLGKETVFPW